MKKIKKFLAFSLAFIIVLGISFAYGNYQLKNTINVSAADAETETVSFMDTIILDREYIVFHSKSGRTHLFKGMSIEEYLDFIELFDYEKYKILDTSIGSFFYVTFQERDFS